EQDAQWGFFERLRKEDPVHYCADSEYGPFWSVTRFNDIAHVEKNHQIFSSEPTITIADLPEEIPFQSFIQMDPPKHDVQRAAVQPVVAPTNLAKLEPIIRERVGLILDQLPVGETFDWVEHVSINLTTQMLATLFDFPFEERRKLTYWSDAATLSDLTGGDQFGPEERNQAFAECGEHFMRMWHERANAPPGNDLISMLAHSERTRNMIDSPMEYLGNIILLIIGGNDTTRNSITGGVLALNQNPAEYDKLRRDTTLIPNMVSEIIRWQTPILGMRRRAMQDTDLLGKQIRKNDKVVMWYVSGNRDDEVIKDPMSFKVDRENARHHLSFGFGIHRCMGNRLAEMQLRVTWEEIMKRFRMVEVVGDVVRAKSNVIRGYRSLPVQVRPL
uniref:cytochrome P450 n=1 Tax=Immundisolibacter sp. TaxID=1934948 RepID=UPI00356B553E